MSNIINYLNPLAFLLSFSIGMFIMMIREPVMNVVIKHPNPYNLDNIYKDKSGECYRYEMKLVECDSNGNIEDIPMNQVNNYIDN